MTKIIRIDDLQDGIRGTFLQRLSPEDLKRKLAESYLGVLTNDETLANPFGNLSAAAQDNINQYLVWIMSQPEYFYFLIKVIFQMKTYPLQCLMLKELYAHKFPILLGARGLSKCLIKDTYIQTSCGIKQISDLGIRDIPHIQQPISESLYGEKTYNKIEYGWYNGKKETRKITSRSGRSIECTLNHPLRVVSNGEIVWKDAEHLKLGDYLVVQRTYKQWENYNSLNKDVAYMIGAIVGDGCYSNKTGVIQFTNMDDDCIENVNKGLYTWAQASLRQGKSQSFQYTVVSNNFRSGEIKKKFWSEFEAKPYNGGDDKETPKIIMGAHFDSIAAYLQGLFDTDGCCVTNSPIAEFSTKSKKLADETQLLLLVLGINSNLKKQFNKKYNKYYYKIVISGNSLREFKDKVGFRIKRKQDMLIKHCSRISNNNIDLVPRELFADKMLAIRELARDCKISSGHGYNYIRSLVRPTRIKHYNMSIEKFGAALDILSKSESARNSKEYKDLKDIQVANYIYDKVVKIEKGFAKTYDVHLEGDDHSFITNGFISHNSYSLAMYFLIKMLLTPGVRCVITGAGFRQAKIVFEYMEQIWKKSKMLQSCFPGKKDGPTHGTDVWTFRLGDSTTYALPVGPDGSKIRGFRANCVGKNTLIQTDIGLVKISEYLNHNCYKVLNINEYLEMPKNIYKTEPTDVYEIITQNGYTIKCSKVHRLLTTNGKTTSWKYAKDLTTEDYLELDNNNYFPDRYVEKNGVIVDENLGYLLGLLISEGTCTNRNYIEITHTNKDLINEIKNRFSKYNWKEVSREAKIDSRGWKCKKSYDIKYSNTEFRETLQKLGLNYNSALDKEIPWCILQSPEKVIIEFLKGLFIGDGSCFRYSSKGKLNVGVSYYTSSINLAEQLQVLLLKFNVVCTKTPRYTKISGNKNYMLAMRGVQAFKIFDIVQNPYWDEHIIKCGHKFERSMKFRKNGDKYIVATTRCNKNIHIGSFSTLEESEKAFKEYWDNTRPALLVKSVTLLKEKEVLFDFTMPKTESFLGGGFVNHNCLVAEEFSCSRKSLVQTDLGLLKIEDIVEKRIKCNVFNMNGELEPIIDWIKTPKTDIYKLTTKYGYTEEVSCNHKFLTADGEWKKVVDLTNKDFIVFDDKYKFPEKEIASYGDISSNDMAYFYGLLVSEGDVTSKTRVQVMNTDRDLIDDLARRIKCLNPKIRKRDAYVDKRGWNCKESYTLVVNNKKFREFLFSQGFDYITCHSKEIPHPILGCSKENVVCFLSGLFAGDGSIFTFKNRQSTKLGVAYYSVCERLINQLHTLLKSMGYIAYKNSRTNHISKNRQWFLRLNGKYALDFAEEIGMKNVLDFKKTLTPYVDRLRNNKGNIFFNKKSNKYLAKVHYNQKSIYLGSRDSSKSAQELIDNFNKSRKLCVQVKKVEKLDEQDHLYDISLPYTHSYYANGLVNHNSVNRAVFEEVMSGFLSVAASPIEQVEYNACMTTMKKLMIPISADIEDNNIIQNQLILSGTAYYKFNHFYQYFHKWREILYTRGDKKKLREILGADQDVENFNWKDYSIIRVPVELIPHGFMDMDQINRTKASSSADVYKREFGVCFSDDSDGFFKRSLINSCTVNEFIPIMKGKQEIKFNPALYGDKNKKYIYGIDPAYQGDNFAIVILEIHDTHRRVVHSWTTQASDHKERVKAGIVTENDYYHYCVKKIRSLMKRFPCAYIALDSDGGGKAIMEAFMDTTKLEPGEEMILPVIDPDDKPKDTDFMQGDHILHVIKFTSEWITEANHSLKKDMEAKDIIFPFHDSISYVEAEYYDESIVGDSKQLYDTLDDCIYDIEELKNELSTITISETATGKERFDTPDIKTGVSKKGRLRKDRYSALLLANWVARTHSVFVTRSVPEDMMTLSSAANRDQGTCFLGNNKIAKALNDLYS